MGALRDIGSSVAFERTHLYDAADLRGRHQLYRYVLSQVPNKDSDLFLKFGVYKGDSINRLADLRPNVRCYGFDSFEGLPEEMRTGCSFEYIAYVRTGGQVAVLFVSTPR
jgi:hypothetical protein